MGRKLVRDGVLLAISAASNLQPDRLSGRMAISFVEFAAVSSAFDHVCCVLVRSFLVRNWCGRVGHGTERTRICRGAERSVLPLRPRRTLRAISLCFDGIRCLG